MTTATIRNPADSMAAGIPEVEATELRGWLERGEATLVDVRGIDEHAREHIAGSIVIPVAKFDSGMLPPGKLVFHCQSGPRSLEAAARARAAGRESVFALKGGLSAWKKAGLPVERSAVPISVLRQMQITVGTMILACCILAALVSPWFIGGAAFFGAGLVFSGTTGTCALSAVILRMPWNAAFRAGPGCGKSC